MAAPIQERRRATLDMRRTVNEMRATLRNAKSRIQALERQVDFLAECVERGADDPRAPPEDY